MSTRVHLRLEDIMRNGNYSTVYLPYSSISEEKEEQEEEEWERHVILPGAGHSGITGARDSGEEGEYQYQGPHI